MLRQLARSLLLRYGSSSSNDDLDESILHLTEALFLPINASDEFSVNIIDISSDLASALVQRSKMSEKLEDANFAIQFLRFLRGQLLNNSGTSQYEMMMSLIIEALGIRAASGSSDGMQDIKEIITTYNELLTGNSDDSEFSSFTAPRLLLAICVCGNGNKPVLDQCIKHLREASILRPNSPVFSIALALSLLYRFDETLINDDFEEARTILNKIIGSPSPGKSLDLWQRLSLSVTKTFMSIRSVLHEKPEYVEEAISHLRYNLHHSFQPDDSNNVTELLEVMEGFRFMYLGLNEDSESTLQEALSPHLKPVAPSPSMRRDASRGDITKSRFIKVPLSKERVDADIRDHQDRLFTLLPGTPNYRQCLEMLVRSFHENISLTNDPTPVDIEEAIKYCRLLLGSVPLGGRSSCDVAISLAEFLKLGFDRTHNNEWLNESIA